MTTNPFTSSTFVSKWFSNYKKNEAIKKFKFIKGLSFYKSKPWLPLYINSGKNLTKGVDYTISKNNETDFKGNVFLIYDIPQYFNIDTSSITNSLRVKKIRQYVGFLTDLSSFKNIDEYMVATFKKSSRYKLKKYKKRFEQCFNISYKMYFGEITKAEYDVVFQNFNKLLVKRFDDKKTTNNNLNQDEWTFYYDVVYDMILEKKASLFVIYDGDQPIGVTLNYFSEDILFDAITVFDIDYSKFHLGSITIMKLIEWGIDNNIQTFDFSKGYFDYKKRWSTKEYGFEYHVLYDKSSFKAKAIANVVSTLFTLKQYLRDKNVNERIHKIMYRFKNKNITTNNAIFNYEFKEVTEGLLADNLIKIDSKSFDFQYLKPIIFNFLYLNLENINDTKLFVVKGSNDYVIEGKNVRRKIVYSNTGS